MVKYRNIYLCSSQQINVRFFLLSGRIFRVRGRKELQADMSIEVGTTGTMVPHDGAGVNIFSSNDTPTPQIK